MAVYKIFPSKDATIYSRYPCVNTGIDEILEVSAKNSLDYLQYTNRKGVMLEKSPYYTYDLPFTEYTGEVILTPGEDIRRGIVYFSSSSLATIRNLTTSSYQANLRLFLAFAQNLTTDYSVQCVPLNQSWEMGQGRFSNVPPSEDGVCWSTTGPCILSSSWSASLGTMVYNNVVGGGVWSSSLLTSQSFDFTANKDVNLNVTSIVTKWFSSSVSNNGFLLKHPDAVELSSASFIDLKYYSLETHTIYAPYLEFKWNDAIYTPITGSSSYDPPRYNINNSITINVLNNKGVYKQDSEYVFRLNARDQYPTRQFTTSSVYLNWRYLMQDSQWSVVDVKTNETVIDFDEQYTKISADQRGNYFKMYMQGLYPERYYKILIRTKILSTNQGTLAQYGTEAEIYSALNALSYGQIAALPYDYAVYDEDVIFKVVK